jgi:shikimate kinase
MKDSDRKNIILTGFMATGKTTVGKTLASQLGYDFVDTDQIIESRIGMTIAEYFQKKGEAAFRKMESELARELSEKRGLVIATGGRFMLDPGNSRALVKTGRVFCLVATPEDILERAESDSQVRPLLQVPNPLEHIIGLLRQRSEGYRQFIQLVTSKKDPETVAREILGLMEDDADPPCPSDTLCS